MAGHKYKNTGLLRAGFQYQDLIAIRTLIEYYGERNLYDWVQLDAEDGEFQSIEDVVACRPDGSYELTQVKFTADPDAPANTLSWRWLTQRLGARKSLLEKWSRTSLRHKNNTSLARAALKTDRVPDADFEASLKGTRVNYSLLPTEVKSTVDEQLESSENARLFFDNFQFFHSQPRLDDLEDRLRSRISSETDQIGWYFFREQVQRWSMLKNQPEPDGKIRHNHLRQALSANRPRPLPQGFRLPPSYNVPDHDFHGKFIEETTSVDGLTVLWGPPGRGKSTYLSYCVACIDSQRAVCIRHHYFLSLDDRSIGRFDYNTIARSLEHQIKSAIPSLESNNDLGQLLEKAARALRQDGRRLIIVIDGLDHVWRDYRDRDDMEELFNVLLPLPENVRLVVGTQKIASEYLPARLRSAFPTERWTELPPMSLTAVERWLHVQDDAGRLNLEVAENQTKDQVLRAVATEFHSISYGSPLHLIYSFEMVTRTGRPVTGEYVAGLPACRSGDIHDYYRSLWERIGPMAKLIVHVLAGLKFGPPRFGIIEWFGNDRETLVARTEINHLLDDRGTEIRPFHGSLFSFVRDLPDHRAVFLAHAPKVLDWLGMRAPRWWRWAWLWITKSQLGDTDELVTGPNRQWAIGAIVDGYPIEQVINILNHAEKAAFDVFDLPNLFRHRMLKTRLLNAKEYQTDHWPVFQEVAVSLSDDPDVIPNLVADLRSVPAFMLPVLVRNTDEPGRKDLVQQAHDELNQRIAMINDGTLAANSHEELAKAIVSVAAQAGATGAPRVEKYAKSTPSPSTLIASYVRESILARKFENIFVVGERWAGKQLDRDVLAALCLEGLAPAATPQLKAITHPAIRCLAILKGGTTAKSPKQPDISSLFIQDNSIVPRLPASSREILYEAFFATLNGRLSGANVEDWSDVLPDPQSTWLSGAVQALERLAECISVRWARSSKWPTLRNLYEDFDLVPPSSASNYDRTCFFTVRLALLDIAVDLCAIGCGIDSNACIDVVDIESVHVSSFWLDELWLDAFSEKRLPLHLPKAAELFVERLGSWFDNNITQFDERAVSGARLAMFALDNNLIAHSRKELKRAVGCLIGYGWRKDMFAFEVIESLDLLAKNGDEDIRDAILDLAGQFEAITEYTDGKETHYAPEEYYKILARHVPERVVDCYAYLIRKEEWHHAEILVATIAESGQFESIGGRAFLESYISPSEVRVLERISSEALPHANLALAIVHTRIGASGEIILKRDGTDVEDSHESDSESVVRDPADSTILDPIDFPPGTLHEYLISLRTIADYRVRQDLVVRWLTYWRDRGQVDEVLVDLESRIPETRHQHDLERSFDVAYRIALDEQGRSEAFRWIVRAHVACSGWDSFGSHSEPSRVRMREVARQFRRNWRDFIKDTSKPLFRETSAERVLSIGLSRLVFFLIEVGEYDLAKTYGLAMASAFKEDLAEQPIEAPEWVQ